MQEMLTRWGFTTVYDLGSNPVSTSALRKRIDKASSPVRRSSWPGDIFPKNGIPIYVPKNRQSAASRYARRSRRRWRWKILSTGDDAIKLFTGSFQGTTGNQLCPRRSSRSRGHRGSRAGQAGFYPSPESGWCRQCAGRGRRCAGAYHTDRGTVHQPRNWI